MPQGCCGQLRLRTSGRIQLRHKLQPSGLNQCALVDLGMSPQPVCGSGLLLIGILLLGALQGDQLVPVLLQVGSGLGVRAGL